MGLAGSMFHFLVLCSTAWPVPCTHLGPDWYSVRYANIAGDILGVFVVTP